MISNNTTIIIGNLKMSKSIGDDLNQVSQNFVIYLPIIFTILGLIGFIGNAFTYLQPELRSNTCCIYSLCGSIIDIIYLFLSLFPNYLGAKYGIYIPWYTSALSCKLNLFFLGFFPHLSISFLLMAIIDRFACTCSFTSPIRRLNQLKMVPFMIVITIIISCLASSYNLILYDLPFANWCPSIDQTTANLLYIILIGFSQPIVMLIFVLLTYRNVRRSRQRVGGTNEANARQSRTQFIMMIFTQIFTTAFFSLQWMIMFIYYTITINEIKSVDQWTIIFFVFTLTNYCYYLNNVKAFYVSMFTSHLFRETFKKSLMQLLPRSIRPRFQVSQTAGAMATVTRTKQGDRTRQ